jgi:hypothetical protein
MAAVAPPKVTRSASVSGANRRENVVAKFGEFDGLTLQVLDPFLDLVELREVAFDPDDPGL